MNLIAIIAGILLVGSAGLQWAIAIYFESSFDKLKSTPLSKDDPKKAVVIMSVRGCDPSLRASLLGVLNQKYADYSVLLVVDSQTDQAWDFVHQLKQEHDNDDVLKIFEMHEPLETCSLKCHAIVQALEHVGDDVEFVALLDADVKPHPTWLAELTGPLTDPNVGGVTGNQWFEPENGSGIGSLVRSTWAGGALVPTIMFANPWAGSFAMRNQDLRASGLAETWKRSVVDDGPIKKAINDLGLKIVFAPSLIMVNREACTLDYVNRWVTRMLTWSRLYEKTFYVAIIHALWSNFVMLSSFAVFCISIATVDVTCGIISAVALIAAGLMCAKSYASTRNCVSKSCEMRGEPIKPLTSRRVAEIFWMAAPAHVVFGISCARAMVLKQIKWRDITYEVKGHDQIKRLNYEPYVMRNSNVSI